VTPTRFEHTVHHSRSDFHDSNCCRSDRPKSTYHSGHSTSHLLAPPAHGPPLTHSVSTLLCLIRQKDRTCITSFSGRSPRTTLWRILTADRQRCSPLCATGPSSCPPGGLRRLTYSTTLASGPSTLQRPIQQQPQYHQLQGEGYTQRGI
jgi:hypothetical protein